MITAAAWTHVGSVRDRNEDAIALPGVLLHGSPPAPIVTRYAPPVSADGSSTLAVVDGMGGHVGGQDASRLVAWHLAGATRDIESELEAANTALFNEMHRRPDLVSMGATIAGIQANASGVRCFNVGDARVYTHQGGYTTLVSIDDRSASGSGEITQSLGGTKEPTGLIVHQQRIPVETPVRVLVCSDGLTDYVDFQPIQETLDTSDAGRAVVALVQLALSAGAPDNVSVLVIDVDPPDRTSGP